MECVDAELLAAGGDVLSCQHGGVGGGLVTVGLDLHSTGDSGDGFAATGITQNVSLIEPYTTKQCNNVFLNHGRVYVCIYNSM